MISCAACPELLGEPRRVRRQLPISFPQEPSRPPMPPSLRPCDRKLVAVTLLDSAFTKRHTQSRACPVRNVGVTNHESSPLTLFFSCASALLRYNGALATPLQSIVCALFAIQWGVGVRAGTAVPACRGRTARLQRIGEKAAARLTASRIGRRIARRMGGCRALTPCCCVAGFFPGWLACEHVPKEHAGAGGYQPVGQGLLGSLLKCRA